MTVIVGLINNGTVWMGGDRCTTNGERRWHHKRPKVFHAGLFLIGYAGSSRVGNLLEHVFLAPTADDVRSFQDVECLMATVFVDRLRKTLADKGACTKEDGLEESPADLLVGIKGRLFEVHEDYQVLEVSEPFAAIGSGAPYALGSLWGMSRQVVYPEASLRIALAAAAHYCPGVHEPFDILRLEP